MKEKVSSEVVESSEEEESSVYVDPHVYGDWIAEVPASCTAEGVKGHYHCSHCDKDFDADHVEIDSLVIPVTEHNYGTWIDEIPSTCVAYGTLGHYHCDGCNQDFDADHQVLSSLTIQEYGSHVGGKHFMAHRAGKYTCGHTELWICDGCGQVLEQQPNSGEWSEAFESEFNLPLTEDKSYFVAPRALNIIYEDCVVDTYNGYSFFSQSGTYEFNIEKIAANFIDTNVDVAAAFNQLKADIIREDNDERGEALADQFKKFVFTEYVKSIGVTVTNVLTTIFASVKNGVIGTTVVADNFINGGTGGGTWISIDPTNTTWGKQDNRDWVPSPYVAYDLIQYANALNPDNFTSFDQISLIFANFMCDVVRCCTSFIVDCEVYYAESVQSGKLYVGGAESSIWWFAYNYAGTSGLTYAGSCNYDASTCANYRLNSAVCGPDSFSLGLSDLITQANWLIANQVDDMFAAK